MRLNKSNFYLFFDSLLRRPKYSDKNFAESKLAIFSKKNFKNTEILKTFISERDFNLQYNACLAKIYLFKVNNRNTRKSCEIVPKQTIKTPQRRH